MRISEAEYGRLRVQTAGIMAFLDTQMSRLSRDQWGQSYQSWARGSAGWNRYSPGGTYINAALAWYQHIHRPGSREWRPSIIIAAVLAAAVQNKEEAHV